MEEYVDIQKDIAGERFAEAGKMRNLATVNTTGSLISRYTYQKAVVDYFL